MPTPALDQTKALPLDQFELTKSYVSALKAAETVNGTVQFTLHIAQTA